MNPQLQGIVDQLKQEYRANPGPAASDLDIAAERSTPLTLRQRLQEEIIIAGLKDTVTEDDLAQAAIDLRVDFGSLCEELASWL